MFDSERLSLRKITDSDLETLYSLDNNPDVMRHINGGTITPKSFVSENIIPLFTRYDDSKPGLGYWIVMTHANSEPLGWCCLREHRSESSVGTVGYRFFPQYWGKGYATESVRLLLDYGFHTHGFDSIRATTYEMNTGSRRVLEKLRFTVRKRFRVDLTEQTTAYFESTEPWPGWDLEYNLSKTDWIHAET